MKKLRPCPFCREKEITLCHNRYYNSYSGHVMLEMAYMCDKCGAKGPASSIVNESYDETIVHELHEKVLRDAWNSR